MGGPEGGPCQALWIPKVVSQDHPHWQPLVLQYRPLLDVILEIGTRIPRDTEHAWRVLKSFQGGENLELLIMRNQQHQTLEIQLESP